MMECQTDYIVSCLRQMLKYQIKSIEVKEEKTQQFRHEMDLWSLTRNFSSGACKGWYKNKDGINFILWPSHLIHYWWITREAHLLEDYWLTLSSQRCEKSHALFRMM